MSWGKSPKILLVLACLSGLVLACSQKVDTEKELERLMQADREFSAFSIENGAAQAFQTYLLKNAVQLPHGQNPIRGRDKIIEDMLEAGSDYTLSWEPQEGEVASSGDMGYTWGVYTLSVPTESGDVQKRTGKYLNVWKKDRSGNWRVLVDMGNQNPD